MKIEDAETRFKDIEQTESVAVDAISAITRAIVQGVFKDGYKADTEHLDEIERKLEEENKALEESYKDLAPVIEAKCKKLDDEAVDLMAEGKKDESAAKTEEAQKIRQKLADIRQKIEENSENLDSIPEEKADHARQLFQDAWPLIVHACLSVEEALVDSLEKIWAGAIDLNTETQDYWRGDKHFQRNMLGLHYKNQMVPSELPGSDKDLSRRFDAFFYPGR